MVFGFRIFFDWLLTHGFWSKLHINMVILSRLLQWVSSCDRYSPCHSDCRKGLEKVKNLGSRFRRGWLTQINSSFRRPWRNVWRTVHGVRGRDYFRIGVNFGDRKNLVWIFWGKDQAFYASRCSGSPSPLINIQFSMVIHGWLSLEIIYCYCDALVVPITISNHQMISALRYVNVF
jgi:hypothetical protein